MKFKTASAISAGLHVAVLLWALLVFSSAPFKVTPAESLPVDLVSEKQFSELTKGVKDAPKPKDKPKPVVEKIEQTQPDPDLDLKAKVTDKHEVKATAEKPPEPAAQPKPDPIAKEIKKDQQVAKNEPMPPRRPPIPQKPQPKFSADKIAALLDKRDPQRNAITGAELNSGPTFGAALGNASQLSQSELDALRSRLMGLWNPPVGIKNPEDYVIRIRIQLGRDGKLTSPPILLSSGHDAIYEAAAASALRAVFRSQPFDMLKPEHYDTWKDIEVTFDPRDMFHG